MLVFATAALASGILAAPFLPPLSFGVFFALLVVTMGIVVATIRRATIPLLGFLGMLFVLGTYQAQQRERPQVTDPSHWLGKPYLLFTGTVDAEPERTASGSLHYPLHVRHIERSAADGLILVTQTERVAAAPHVGDTVTVRGTLEAPRGATNPGGFDYGSYLRRKSIFAVLRVRHAGDASVLQAASPFAPRVFAAKLRRTLLATVAASPLTPDEKALVGGILLSEREGMPADIASDFERTGAVHILSVSGLHLAVFATLLVYLSKLLPPNRTLRNTIHLVAILCLWLFALAAGFSSATVRSAVMITILLLAPVVRRDAGPLHSLVVALLAILLVDPLAVYDAGAQLSFACVAGLVVWISALQQVLIPFEPEMSPWRSRVNTALLLLLTGIVAQVAALPLTVFHFSVVSLVAPLAGLVLVPVSEFVLVGALVTAAGCALVPLPAFVWMPVAWLVKLLAGMTHLCAAPELAAVSVPAPPPWSVWIFYVVFFGTGLVFRALILRRVFLPESKPRLTVPQLAALPALGLVVLPLMMILLPTLALRFERQRENRVRITFLDVGQGDAAVIETPDAKVAVVDGGGYPGRDERFGGDPGSRVVVPFLRRRGVNAVDLLVPTHPDEDHVQGLIAVARAFPVRQVLDGGVPDDGMGASARLRDRLKQKRVPVHIARRGEQIPLGTSGAVLEVLHPTNPLLTETRSVTNANSIVLRLRCRHASILLTGDAEEAAEASLLQSGLTLQSDVLKVGHHGSRLSSGATFLLAVRPKAAIISVGADNNFGHPAPDVLTKLKQVGAMVYRTDLRGAVTVETDGDRIYVLPTVAGTDYLSCA